MKKILLALQLMLLPITICASDGSLPTDTVFKYENKIVSIKSIDDSLELKVVPSTSLTDSLLRLNKKEKIQSSVIHDGSNYNFVFSWKKKRDLSPHWAGIGFSFINYDDDKISHGGLKQSQSYNISLNLFEYYSRVARSNWLLVTGIGFDWSRYHFDDNAALTKTDGVTTFVPAPDDVDYKSSKLLAYYITVPLLLEYQIPLSSGNNFNISGGVVGYLKYYSKSQVKYYTDNKKNIEDKGRDLNIRPIDLKFRLQVGFNDICVFGNYSPFSMFGKDKGPDLKMYSMGIMLTF